MQPPYTYRAEVISVYDGDTFTALLDLGFDVYTRAQFRLALVDTPEIRGGNETTKAQGRAARDRVRVLILNQTVTIRSEKNTGKYGRWIGHVTLADGRDLSDVLLSEGHARLYS